ncbi:unnamed protein product [Brassica rapa subsp. trilocularis]
MSSAVLGFGSTLLTGIIGFGDGHGCALIHSFASVIAFKIVSLGVRSRFSNRSKFLACHRDQTIQAARVPGPIPTGGREGNSLAFSQPSMVVAASCGLKWPASGANSQTCTANGQWKRRCATDSSVLQRLQRVDIGMLLIANCSPTGRAPCRDFHRKILIFSVVLMFQTDVSHLTVSTGVVGVEGVELVSVSVAAKYPERVENSPEGFFNQTKSSDLPNLLGLIFKICSLWKGSTCSSFSTSQSVLPGRNRSETVRCWRCSGAGPNGLTCSQCESHGSDHISMLSPDPTIHPSWFLRRSLPMSTPLQPCEEEEGA